MDNLTQNKVVLILGVEMRSGTKYLYDLLGMHPQCRLASETPEDFVVAESAYLDKFIRSLSSLWKNHPHPSCTLGLLRVKEALIKTA